MDAKTIVQDLKRRFSQPLPEFYKRRIIFWYDEDREFEDQLDDFAIDGVKLVVLTGSNTFAAKKLLCEDDLTSNYLVYDPRPFTKDDDNWLINVQLYSEEFHADQNSIWMDEMGLPATPVIRNQIKHYRKFFKKSKKHRDAVKKLSDKIATAAQMHLAVMSTLCGCNSLDPGKIIKAVLCASLDMEANDIYQSFLYYGVDNPFWILIAQATGYNDSEHPDLERLAAHIILTAVTRTLSPEYLIGLEDRFSVPHQAFCYDFVFDWMHSAESEQLFQIARCVEEEYHLPRRFSKLAVEDLIDTECFPCMNEIILIALMKDICNDIVQADIIKRVAEKRRAMVWYDSVADYYNGLLQVADMQMFFVEHSAGFHTVEPHKIWMEYTGDYYRMDTYYRKFHLCFQNSLKSSNPLLDDLFKQVADKVEGLYSHWFLGLLGQNWTNACAESMEQYGRIFEVPQQTDFYRTKIKPSDNRIFVIISDAFRYEVAASLSETLQRDLQCRVTLKSCEGIFPTVTKYGMAALLPHKKLSVVSRTNGNLSVLADGQSTEAGNRDKVLKSANPKSTALKYKQIIGMKRTERQSLVKGMDVVYFYHDKIDEASHTSDSAVFAACDEAITEIKNLIRIIVNEFGGTNVIVTADHGFLYTYSPLSEDNKVDKSTPSEQDIEIDRRYIITQKGAKPDYLLPIQFMDGNTEYDAFAPGENVRIKKKGGGLNFVHGGISLQEMVVPVLEFQFLRNSYKSYQRNKEKIDTTPVTITLLSASRKISNMIFSLSFYQKEAVGGNNIPSNFLVYFVDSNGQRISDTNRIIADKTSDNTQDRTFRCNFSLRSQKYNNRDLYYLIIADESGTHPPVQEEFQIDIAFAVDEFNFF